MNSRWMKFPQWFNLVAQTPLSLPRILSATAVARAAARFLYPS